jgi:hypothetical protein
LRRWLKIIGIILEIHKVVVITRQTTKLVRFNFLMLIEYIKNVITGVIAKMTDKLFVLIVMIAFCKKYTGIIKARKDIINKIKVICHVNVNVICLKSIKQPRPIINGQKRSASIWDEEKLFSLLYLLENTA